MKEYMYKSGGRRTGVISIPEEGEVHPDAGKPRAVSFMARADLNLHFPFPVKMSGEVPCCGIFQGGVLLLYPRGAPWI